MIFPFPISYEGRDQSVVVYEVTASHVLQDSDQPGSHVSIDTAILTAQRLVHLRFEDAQATNPVDKAPWRTAVG